MKRMQVLIEEAEFRRFKQSARQRGVSLAEWVRQALRAESRRTPRVDADRKLAAIRAAAAHEFPTAGIDQMLDEIARGYEQPGLA